MTRATGKPERDSLPRSEHALRKQGYVSSLKDTNRAPRAVLNVTRARNAGSPNRREPHGDGASVIVRGRESRPRGEGRQVDRNERTPGEVRCFRLQCQPDRSRLPGTGEPDALKGASPVREGVVGKVPPQGGNSLAVYLTTRCGSKKADPADIGPEATPAGASVSSDRRAQGDSRFG